MEDHAGQNYQHTKNLGAKTEMRTFLNLGSKVLVK